MTTSTPKNKLYGYLKGYEPARFTGSDKSSVVSSFIELEQLEMDVLDLDTRNTSTLLLISRLRHDVDKFLTAYYSRIQRLQSKSKKIKDLADSSKKDAERLSDLLSQLLSGSTNPTSSVAVCPITSDHISSVIDICDGKCPYYLSHKFCMLYDRDTEEEPEFELFTFKVPEYKHLALALVRIAAYLITDCGIKFSSLLNYHMLFEYVLSISHIYELMNPSGETRQEYLDSAEELLTQKPLDSDSPTYKRWEAVLDSVFEDIKEGKLPYIQDIKRALDKNRDFIMSKYDDVRDSYCSMKGTAQSTYTGCRESLISSAFEVDQYKDLFKEYDEYIGYKSRYPEKDESFNGPIPSVRTILIDNPGKFKPRIIHIGDNPIQDRCTYLHRRLKAVLDDMRCDCTSDQEKGRQFLKDLTLEWYLQGDSSLKKGIYGFDFSNATDTLDQHFQYKVLEFVFGPEVANFWNELSKLDKYISDSGICDSDFKYHKYTQTCGQPQGLRGSFVAFAFAHHFIFLMDMKVLHLENLPAWKFYSLLGDDSISNSIFPEIDTYDENDDSSCDEMGFHRSQVELVHFGICKDFAGFKINYDKSQSIHHCSLEAKLDFAKVTYRNGQLFTPTPFRLAMNFSKNDNTRLAVAIWRMERGDPKARSFLEKVIKDMNPDIKYITQGGQIPFLRGFDNDQIKLSEPFASRLRYACALTYLTTALGFVGLSDKARDSSNEDLFDRSIGSLFNKKLQQRLDNVDPNHKVMLVIERNSEILSVLDEIYSFEDLDDQYLALACSTFGEDSLKGDFFDCLYNLAQTSRLLRLAKANPDADISIVYPDFDMRMQKTLKGFSEKFVTRGIAKRPREEVFMLKNILSVIQQLDDVLGPVPRQVMGS